MTDARDPDAAQRGTARRTGLLQPALTIGLVSAASMAVEIIAGRAIAPYVGMSLYTWTMIIAVVLAGLSLGHWAGGVAADRARRPGVWVAVSLLLAAATTLGSLAVLRMLEPALQRWDPISHVGALTLAAFFAPSFFAGVVSPILTAMALAETPEARRGRVLGLVFALGAGGAILGTLAGGLVLVSWLGVGWSMALVGGVYALLALPYALTIGRGAGIGVAAAAVLGATLAGGTRWAPCDLESAFYCIQIDELGAGATARVMALDHLVHGVNVETDPTWLLSPYVQGVDELTDRRFPGDGLEAFFIGGGAYTLPRAWLTRYPEGRFIATELDPEVTRAAQERLWLPRSERLDIRHGDARRILRELPPERRFDVVFGDAFHDVSIPQHLVTDEFHALVKARLTPDGIYAVNVVDLLRAPRFLLSLATTLRRRFDSVELWLNAEDLGPVEKRTTWIVLASDRPSAAVDQPAQIASRRGPSRSWVRVPLDAMIAAMPPGESPVLTDDYSPVDRLLAPLLLKAERAER